MNDMEEIFEISNSKCCTRLEGVSMFFVLLLYNMQSWYQELSCQRWQRFGRWFDGHQRTSVNTPLHSDSAVTDRELYTGWQHAAVNYNIIIITHNKATMVLN